jgi:hypothetical protein
MATISGEVALMTSGDEVHRKADRCAGEKNRQDAARQLEALRGAHHQDDRHRGERHRDEHHPDEHRRGEHRPDEHRPDDPLQGARHRIDPLTVVRRSAESRSDGSVPALNSADAGRSASPRAGGRQTTVWGGRDGHPAADCPHSG